MIKYSKFVIFCGAVDEVTLCLIKCFSFQTQRMRRFLIKKIFFSNEALISIFNTDIKQIAEKFKKIF